MSSDSWPSELAQVSRNLYINATIFEIICLVVIFFLSVLATKKYITRKQKAALHLTCMYYCYFIAFLMTIIAKLLILIENIPFSQARGIEKGALIGGMLGIIFLILFDMEIFLNFKKKKRILIISLLLLIILPVIIHQMIYLTEQTPLYIQGIFMALTFIIFIFHLKISFYNYRRADNKMNKIGMLLIFLQGVSLVGYLLSTLASALLIVTELLAPFNFLYFMASLLMVLSLFFSYLGYFMPKWFRKNLN